MTLAARNARGYRTQTRVPRGAPSAALPIALAGALLLWLSAAGPALAVVEPRSLDNAALNRVTARSETPPAPSRAAGYSTYWVGRYCTSRACANSNSKPTPLAHAAGFGMSVIGALWIAGRPSAKR